MTHQDVQTEFERTLTTLAGKWRSAGVVLVSLDLAGTLLPARDIDETDWLTRLVRRPGITRSLMQRAAATWADQDVPQPMEASPGLWLCPTPTVHRRERTGYVVAVMLCHELLESEQFAAMCQGAALDQMLCRSQLANMPPIVVVAKDAHPVSAPSPATDSPVDRNRQRPTVPVHLSANS